MKILVVGANGFVGKHLMKTLGKNNIQAIAFTEYHETWHADIFNPYLEIGITHVVHLIAKSFVPDSWDNPEKYIQTNLNSTVSVLEFCRKSEAGLIFMSSYMYGIPQHLPINEQHPVSVLNPYALSKYLSEKTCIFFATNYKVSVSILRVFNIYGPGQKSSFLIPHIINEVLHKNEIHVKDLKPRRDYIYIDDFISFILGLMNKQIGLEIFNIGSGVSYSVSEIIQIIQGIAKTDKAVISSMETRPNEIMDIKADISKIELFSGSRITTEFKEGLEKCIQDVLSGSE